MKGSVKSLYSGTLGWIVCMDEKTQYVAKELAMKLSSDAEYVVQTPHITLYHARLNKIPRKKVVGQMKPLMSSIGKNIIFNDVSSYGMKFLFWDVENKKEIQPIHEIIVDEFSKYLVMNEKALAEKEGLEMGGEELKNLTRYGHPLVKKLFRPHITLAYDSGGINVRDNKKHVGKILNFQFVEIGEYGGIKKVLLSSNKTL